MHSYTIKAILDLLNFSDVTPSPTVQCVCVCEFVCVWAFVCVSVTYVRRPNYKTMCVGADFRTAFEFGFTIKHLISQSPLSPTATLLLSYYLSLFLFIVPLSDPFCLPVRVCVCVSVTSFDCPLTSEVCLSSTRCLHFPISRGLILLHGFCWW